MLFRSVLQAIQIAVKVITQAIKFFLMPKVVATTSAQLRGVTSDAAKAVIYSLFFTALALLALHQSGLDSSFGTLAGFLELAVYFGAQMVAYSMTLNITMVTALTVSILTTLIYTCVTRALVYVG